MNQLQLALMFRIMAFKIVILCLVAASNIVLPVFDAHAASDVMPKPTTVHFSASDDTTQLRAELFKPKGEKRFPAVVMLHGCTGIAPFADRYRQWAEDMQQWGYVALLVDSHGPRGLKDCRSGTRNVVQERVEDAYRALRYLQAQPFIRGSHISVIGWSNGGTVLLRALDQGKPQAAKRPTPIFRAAIAFYPKCFGNESFRTPLLMLMGAEDYRAPAAPCTALTQAAQARGESVVIEVYEGAGHGFDSNTTAGGAPKKAVQQFLAKYLGQR
ncbi:MAG: hypothetical protein ETSY1_40660 [Candidatus Entotheonella factor]|uniref:Dienelactone hydrolase domain-containing protein n=1 Tax=Entotheonella factor TaxID=1429438 RepID=W4L5Z4_ENTF1|nr:dienelactone hydrolase family protein [Candidatus Entotheonella palauensis]ETW93115.1 MAG: hypothetical protein ETSY1_40660 [Candidatus Entotheonella factor]